MNNQVQIKNNIKPSRLERFSLNFEYDKTLRDVKSDMKSRFTTSES